MKLTKLTAVSLLSVAFMAACGTGEQGQGDDVGLRRVTTDQNTVNNGGSNTDNGANVPGNGADNRGVPGNGTNGGTTDNNGGMTGGTNGGTLDDNGGMTGGTNGTTGDNGGMTGGTNGTTGGAGGAAGDNNNAGDGEYNANGEGKVGGSNGAIYIADKAQNKVENLKEVSHASVIVVNERAYVGVLMDKHAKDGLNKDVKKKIEDAVKATDKDVKKVYSSSNPEVIEQMGEYGDKIQNNEAVKGLSGEFTKAMKEFFPEAN